MGPAAHPGARREPARRAPGATERIDMASDAAAPAMRATTVLWDIDGTLLRSGGVAAQAFLDAVAEVTGARPTPEHRDYGGRLDLEIADMLLAAVGAKTTQ